MADHATGSDRPSFAQRASQLIAHVDDGQLLRMTFYVMLVATIAVIGTDLWEQYQREAGLPEYDPTNAPILPAVDRPELDPDSPALRPDSDVIVPPEVLGAPLSLTLAPNGILKLEGTIVPGAAEELAAELELRSEYIQTISLNSPGGVVQEALKMGQLIRDGGYETHVQSGHFCASSCPLLLAAGEKRNIEIGAVIGVHQIYQSLPDSLDPRNSAAQAMSDAQALTAHIGRYLDDMGIDPRLWFHALETPPNRLYYLTEEEMREFALIAEGTLDEQTS